jgi:hypothetical protein
MTRPKFISEKDIKKFNKEIPESLRIDPILLEVIYAGKWLVERLIELQCSSDNILRIQWTAGQMSFGNDPWEVHQKILNDFLDNKLIFEEDVN